MQKYLSILFFILSCVSLAYLISITDISYIYNMPMTMTFPVKSHPAKNVITQGESTHNKLDKTFYASIYSNNEFIKLIQSTYCFECQNIPISIFNLINYFTIIFVMFVLSYIFIRKIFIFPFYHPPKSRLLFCL